MILESDKPIHIWQTFADPMSVHRDARDILASAHASAKRMFGANYRTAVEPVCESIRKIMTKSGYDAITVGYLIVDEMERIGEPINAEKAITMAAIYEVGQEKSPNKN